MEKTKLLGVLGGLGPMATVYFYELLTALTDAKSDQEHIDMVISSRATTPDRTAFILGESKINPIDDMIEDAKKLVAFGAEIIAIPCNTAHYFYDQLAAAVNVPILNIVEESVACLKNDGVRRFGLLATDGTVQSGTYQKYCKAHDITCVIPDKNFQKMVMTIIYDQIKQGKRADMQSFEEIEEHMRSLGCERLILGCTELSLIKRDGGLSDYFTDSLECLALATIRACGKQTIR